MTCRAAAPDGCTILDKLNQDIRDVGAQPETVRKMHAQPMAVSQAEASEFIRATSEKWRPVIQGLNIAFED